MRRQDRPFGRSAGPTCRHGGRRPRGPGRRHAADMAAALRRLGFEVTTELDAARVELIEALRAFTRLSAGADVVPRALRTLRTTASPAPDDRVVPLSP